MRVSLVQDHSFKEMSIPIQFNTVCARQFGL